MGRNSKSKRDAKHRRSRPSPGGRPGAGSAGTASDPPFGAQGPDAAVHDAVIRGLAAAAFAHERGDRSAAREYAARFGADAYAGDTRVMDGAISRALAALLPSLWLGGWLPVDLHQLARRHVSDKAASLVADAMAADCATFSAATVDPRWRRQLEQIDARTWWDASRPHLSQWLDRHGVTRANALQTLVELVAVLNALPRLPSILPQPGTASIGGGGARRGVDEKMLTRVRALLAKAESTAFPEEAEALSAKAQELMSRYAIERAMLDLDTAEVLLPGARRIWLDQPYLSAKSLLVAAVALANRSRSISSVQLGFVTVIGDELDLDIVELLTTSLMVQATSAMLVAGRRVGSYGQSRTRSFRQSFLISYATRIGERLQASAAATVATAGTELVPVFAERERVVRGTFETLFPDARRRSFSIGNADGWVAGRAAADAAVLQADRTAVGQGVGAD